MAEPQRVTTLAAAVERIVAHAGPNLVVAIPLGLGKPNPLINALYRHVAAHPALSLMLYTALSLGLPRAGSDLERRFLGPFLKRMFGADYPELDYVRDRAAGRLPANIRVHEFYFQSGSLLGNSAAQRDYISINYTHVAREMAASGVNVILQLVASRNDGAAVRYSLSSNPDVTLDLLDRFPAAGPRPLLVGMLHGGLPFLANDAEVPATLFDLLVETADPPWQLFGIPRAVVADAEFAIGLHASTLVRDGGTLQIGIGALSDALVHALIVRHQDNADYRRALNTLGAVVPPARGGQDDSAAFERGLYGASEMLMDGFMHLVHAGVLKRRVYDDLRLQRALNQGVIGETLDGRSLEGLLAAGVFSTQIDEVDLRRMREFGVLPESARLIDAELEISPGLRCGVDLTDPGNRQGLAAAIAGRQLRSGRYLHGAFYLGSSALYQWLRELRGADFDGLCMTRVSHINELYGGAEALHIAQRHEARFFNTCMMQTLLGAAVSDALADGQVVSGVGGQYNFVAMAHALRDGRSVLMLRSYRGEGAAASSNIVWNYGHTTIPRHLRDIVVTEYGIADLRGQSDEQVIQRLLAISDSRFQDGLAAQARRAGKLHADWRIPQSARNNTPARIAAALRAMRSGGHFAAFPFGHDFTAEEERLVWALQRLKAASGGRLARLRLLLRGVFGRTHAAAFPSELQRMDLAAPRTFKERLYRRLLSQALAANAKATD